MSLSKILQKKTLGGGKTGLPNQHPEKCGQRSLDPVPEEISRRGKSGGPKRIDRKEFSETKKGHRRKSGLEGTDQKKPSQENHAGTSPSRRNSSLLHRREERGTSKKKPVHKGNLRGFRKISDRPGEEGKKRLRTCLRETMEDKGTVREKNFQKKKKKIRIRKSGNR